MSIDTIHHNAGHASALVLPVGTVGKLPDGAVHALGGTIESLLATAVADFAWPAGRRGHQATETDPGDNERQNEPECVIDSHAVLHGRPLWCGFNHGKHGSLRVVLSQAAATATQSQVARMRRWGSKCAKPPGVPAALRQARRVYETAVAQA